MYGGKENLPRLTQGARILASVLHGPSVFTSDLLHLHCLIGNKLACSFFFFFEGGCFCFLLTQKSGSFNSQGTFDKVPS